MYGCCELVYKNKKHFYFYGVAKLAVMCALDLELSLMALSVRLLHVAHINAAYVLYIPNVYALYMARP